ncbi:hypothetical protein [Bacillus sp. UNCCL81]|uniref:hypothetical protein n=1 Tax=Bacillus sp. UNCCL81 TaxID=1502755 RepID=UPI0008E6BAC7|nr:hypothetical protein [Bacillus sp. UNCCL81]SFC52651.1 hypothetical protein SAMN02799633_01096 [Bacillus sp. UNCCL81]
MIWLNICTLIISFCSLFILFYNAYRDTINKRKDRTITILLSEKRRMQSDLMDHITKVLHLVRKTKEELNINEKKNVKLELLNHKVFIWINLDNENNFSEELRDNLNDVIFKCASFLEKEGSKDEFRLFITSTQNNEMAIWQLIDKYIEEEKNLIEELI